ncbi:hypothetical protein DR864_01925 [Runella rosea]|uniref:Uncharacterized protein n=1 Tax=Runella rosea TaxID=2259595 RepID=A0A344TD51_9BACT|nr:hypothetical protein [Runella rosea]AXE16572.1 hypothetical protein DR864_01925 [Runella rosea]
MPLERLFRFSLGLYTLDVTTKSENNFAGMSLGFGAFSLFLIIMGLLVKSPLLFPAAIVGGILSIGLGIGGIRRRAQLLTSKYRDFAEKELLRLGKKRSWLGIVLGIISLCLGLYFY